MSDDEKHEYQYEDELTKSRNAPEYKPGMSFKDRVKIVHKLNYTTDEVIKHTANKGVAEMIGVMQKKGITNTFDRFSQQHPQCGYGLTGACCAFCSYGPCRVDDKTGHSVCGKNVDLIVAGNAVRRMAAGLSAHGAHAREIFLTLKAAAQGKVNLPIKGGAKAIVIGKLLGIRVKGKTVKEISLAIADRFIDDLQRAEPKKHDTLLALAPYERTKAWEELGIIPISAYHECFEANNITSHGTDSDFDSHMEAFLRTALVYAWSTVIATSIATDILYGIPKRAMINVNLGAIEPEGMVNIALNGHTPTVAMAIADLVVTDRILEKAKAVGAEGIKLYGMCCTGGEFIERDLQVPMVSMASSSEMAVATGAFEAVVVDQQDILPGISKVTKQFHTKLITTSASTRKEGAIPIEIDYYFSNLDNIHGLAEQILDIAIENYPNRDQKKMHIPNIKAKMEAGFGVEEVMKIFNGSIRYNLIYGLAELIRAGKIRGLVNFGSCGNIRGAVFERNQVIIAKQLIKNDVLVTCHGCSGMGLLFAGLAHPDAASVCGERLKEVITAKKIPPVLHVGACTDSTRAGQIMAFTAMAAGIANQGMPFAMVAADPAAEKAMGARFAFVLQGIETYSCVQDNTLASDRYMEFTTKTLKEKLGASLNWNPDPYKTSEDILRMLDKKRAKLGWPVWDHTIGKAEEIEADIPETIEVGEAFCPAGFE